MVIMKSDVQIYLAGLRTIGSIWCYCASLQTGVIAEFHSAD
jgi:hypothetical protein